MFPLHISATTLTSCLGQGLQAHRAALRNGTSGLQPCDFETVALPTWIGTVSGTERVQLPDSLARYDCRNNRLALLALETDGFAARARAAVQRHGRQRVGVFLGTSTAGIFETELAYRVRDPNTGALPPSMQYQGAHCPFSVSDFVRQYLGIDGPAFTLSTACSSSAKVFAAAARQIALGVIDAAVVGGVDSLCLTTLYGFASLQLVSSQPARPYDAGRDGISIGEAAAFALLERTSPASQKGLYLLGTGESSDAHHMSTPHPEGLGARQAIEAALRAARLAPQDVDYVNLHGTATPSNDAAEGRAMMAVFPAGVPCNSTKGATGHTLGAAGAVEAVIATLALADGWIPGSPGTQTLDPALPLDYRRVGAPHRLRTALSNSFGFGGSNCSLILGTTL